MIDRNGIRKHRETVLEAVIFALAVLLMAWPLFRRGMFYAADSPYHLARIWSLADALKNGVFPVKVHPLLCWGCGYGTGFFYSDLFLYIPALLICAGLSLELAVKIFLVLIAIAILVITYHTVSAVTHGSRLTACLISVLYLTSFHVLGALYGVWQMGTYMAAAFIPPAVAGLYSYLSRGTHLRMFILGFTGLFYTHAISTFLTGCACIIMVILCIDMLIRNPKRMIHLLAGAALILLLSMSYWMPMLEQFKAIRFKNSIPMALERDHVLAAGDLLKNDGIGIPLILILLADLVMAAAVILKRIKSGNSQIPGSRLRECMTYLIIGMIFLLLPFAGWFWNLVNRYVSLIEFPSRLMIIPTVMFLLSAAILLEPADLIRAREDADGKGRTATCNYNCIMTCLGTGMLAVSLAVSSVLLVTRFQKKAYSDTDHIILYQVMNNEIGGLGAGDTWLPLMADRATIPEAETACDSDGQIVKGIKSKGYSVFTFEADLSKSWYDVPFVHYKGYTAVDETGQEYLTSGSEVETVRVFMPENTEGVRTITVQYSLTKYCRTAYAANILSGVIYLLFGIVRKHRRKGNKAGTLL